jgi:CTP:molybdopterin cytidylyltransferase MocA
MGRPKGLCRCPGDERPFLDRIVRLYGAAGIPVAVVTTAPLRRLYQAELATDAVRIWIERPPGGGTAASAGAALAALAETASHVWLHPVDLPDVRPASLRILAVRSRAEPRALLVAGYRDRPGHPVIVPVAPLGQLADPSLPGRMCDRLREACAAPIDGLDPIPRRRVVLADPGLVSDYDVPADLQAGPDGTPQTPSGGES